MNIRVVDAFTAEPFKGNPAAVCVMERAASETWMQSVAGEMNLSETAFLAPESDGFRLRWFTPSLEVALCGHATLASAHVLWQDGHLPEDGQARFHTLSGLLTADREGDWIRLDFPATRAEPAETPPALLTALGIEHASFVGRNVFDYIVEIDSETVLRELTPDTVMLSGLDVRGVIVTCPSSSRDFDFVSRFFAPAAGVPEDPVTGSAHCCLGPYWAARLGRSELTGYQASARGGVVKVAVRGERVRLYGQAVTVLKGELMGTASVAT